VLGNGIVELFFKESEQLEFRQVSNSNKWKRAGCSHYFLCQNGIFHMRSH